LKMKDGEFQVPPVGGDVKYTIKKLRLRSDIDSSWSMKKIVTWARK